MCYDSFKEEDRTLNGIKSGITSWRVEFENERRVGEKAFSRSR